MFVQGVHSSMDFNSVSLQCDKYSQHDNAWMHVGIKHALQIHTTVNAFVLNSSFFAFWNFVGHDYFVYAGNLFAKEDFLHVCTVIKPIG
jgi:hypothetical protein